MRGGHWIQKGGKKGDPEEVGDNKVLEKEAVKMKLDEEGLTNFSVGRTFQREKRINFLDFSYDGQRLITSGEDDQMVIYDCEKGTEKQVTD